MEDVVIKKEEILNPIEKELEKLELAFSDLSLISEIDLPVREEDPESATKLSIYFFVDWDKGSTLMDLARESPTPVEKEVLEVLGLQEEPEYAIAPGGVYHRYSIEIPNPDILLVYSTTSLNI